MDAGLIRSTSAVNFAYIVYLKLRQLGVSAEKIESAVRRWFVMSILTGRYSGSPESAFDFDIKQIARRGIDAVLQGREAADLSEAFWSASLVQALNPPVASNPNFRMNAIPESVFEMELADYDNFLAQRRRLMAAKRRDFHFSL